MHQLFQHEANVTALNHIVGEPEFVYGSDADLHGTVATRHPDIEATVHFSLSQHSLLPSEICSLVQKIKKDLTKTGITAPADSNGPALSLKVKKTAWNSFTADRVPSTQETSFQLQCDGLTKVSIHIHIKLMDGDY